MKTLTHTYNHVIRYGPRAGETETVTWKASAHHVKELLGLNPKAHFPADGLAPRDIQGVSVYVTPDRKDGRRKHRVFAICACGRHVPAGRMFSHKCVAV